MKKLKAERVLNFKKRSLERKNQREQKRLIGLIFQMYAENVQYLTKKCGYKDYRC